MTIAHAYTSFNGKIRIAAYEDDEENNTEVRES